MIWTGERKITAHASLEAWKGTPHHNRIAIRGVGVDCIKFVCKIYSEAGIFPDIDFHGYSVDDGMWKESTRLQDTMLRCLHSEWVPSDQQFEFGDIAIFKTGDRSAHCGFVTGEDYVWHALGHRMVTKSDMCLWRRAIIGVVRVTQEGYIVRPDKLKF